MYWDFRKDFVFFTLLLKSWLPRLPVWIFYSFLHSPRVENSNGFWFNDQKIWYHKIWNCLFPRDAVRWNRNRFQFNKVWSTAQTEKKSTGLPQASGFLRRVRRKISGCNELALCFYAFNIKINCRFFFASFISFLSFSHFDFSGKHFSDEKKLYSLSVSLHEICDMFFSFIYSLFSRLPRNRLFDKMMSLSMSEEMFVGGSFWKVCKWSEWRTL